MFELREYEDRLTRVQSKMREQNLDALLVADPANMYYLTGYNAWSFYTPQLLFVPQTGAVTLYTRAMDAHGALRTAKFLDAQHVVGYPENLVHRPDTHPAHWIAEHILANSILNSGADQRIGYEGDAQFFNVRAFLALQEILASHSLVESHNLVNWVRLIKSEAEIALLRQAGAVASHAMRTAIDAVNPGVAQFTAAAAVMSAQATGVSATGGDYPAIVPMFLAGEGSDTPHLTWSEAAFEAGGPVSVELAGVYKRYHAPLARTVSLGEPSAALREVAEVTKAGVTKVLQALQPGAKISDVVGLWDDVLAAAGLSKASRLGYSIGIGYPPDWGERTVSLRAEDETQLQPGMAFHLIAGMWQDDFGFELSESLVVTQTGIEILTDVPRELIVK